MQYRNTEGRSRRLVFGRYGVMTVEQARREAKTLLGEIAGGHDPATEQRPLRDTITVAEICDWYLSEAEASRLLGRRQGFIRDGNYSWRSW